MGGGGRRACARPHCSLIRRSIGSFRRSRSRAAWRSREHGDGAFRRARDGDGRVGSGVPGGRARDDGGGAQAPGAGAGLEAGERPGRRVHREVPRRAGAGGGDDARGARGCAQLAVHRASGATSAGALTVSRQPRTPSRALTTFAVGFLLLDGVLLAYSGLALHRTMLVVWGGACIVAAGRGGGGGGGGPPGPAGAP